MPFNDALFWFGLTAFGTGLYFLIEGNVKRRYSVGVTVIGLLGCAYAEYRYYHPNIPAIPLWVILLLLTWSLLGYAVYIHRFRRMPSPSVEKPKELSKLVIHSANYRAWQGGGNTYDVTEFLRKIISGDSLVFDIENHNFVIGNQNFVPIDPLSGKVKRLRVTFSYKGDPASTIERSEHDRLVLPEDSVIQRLTSEVNNLNQQLQAAGEECDAIKQKCKADRLLLHWPNLECGGLKNMGFMNDDFYGAGVTVRNIEMRYASTARDLRASVKLVHAASKKEVIIEKGCWHYFDGQHHFTDKVSLSMGERSELLLFEWRCDKVPRHFFAVEPTKTTLEHGEWTMEVRLIGDNFIGDFKIPPLVLTPSGGIPGCA